MRIKEIMLIYQEFYVFRPRDTKMKHAGLRTVDHTVHAQFGIIFKIKTILYIHLHFGLNENH